MIVRKPETHAVLALGSNLGDREATLAAAVAELRSTRGVRVLAVSEPIESIAVRLDGEAPDHPHYLNQVVIVGTTLEPLALLDAIQRIEDVHGRVRIERWGDRTLDIDIIDFGGETITSDRLTVPHPRAAERLFVLEPWLQLDPAAVIPGAGSAAELIDRLHAAKRENAG